MYKYLFNENKISAIRQSVIQTFYDIVKAHGGELRVETLSAEAAAQAGKEGVGSEFVVSLPIV